MTKGERRKARQRARTEGRPLTGELALDRGQGTRDFTETRRGYKAREHWARWYDSLNGRPDGDGDR